jgi:hypothetical protein
MSEKKIEEILGKVAVSRREAVRKLIVSAAFSLPVVMSFTMGGIPVHRALAQSGNSTNS